MSDGKTKNYAAGSEESGQEVPTLTSLLYRKNLVKTDSSKGKGKPAMTLEATRTDVTPELVISDFAKQAKVPSHQETGEANGGKPRLLKSQWVPDTGPATDLWKTPELGRYGHPVAGALAKLGGAKFPANAAFVFEQGEIDGASALLLKQIYHATLPGRFRGMRLRAEEFSDVFGRLAKFGFTEFAPLGLSAQGNFDRAAFRAAFGLESGEWLTLVRLGTSQPITQIVAFISTDSLQAFLPTFHGACGAAAPEDATRAVG